MKFNSKLFSSTKSIKVIVILIFFSMFLIGNVSAFEFDNKLTYSNNDLKVELRNSFLLIPTTYIGTAELKSHSSVTEIKQFGYGKEEIVMYYDFDFLEIYEDGLGEVYFTDERTGKEIQKDYSFVYWANETYEKNIYEEQCSISSNGTNFCEDVFVGKENSLREVWKPYNSKDIPKGKIRIGLKTYVNQEDYIDGIWTIAGKRIEKHATWEGGLNVDLTHYYKLDDPSGEAIDSLGTTNLTNNGATQGVAGLIGTAYDFDGTDHLSSLPTNTFETTGFSINMWINNSRSDTSMMFLGGQDGNGLLFDY